MNIDPIISFVERAIPRIQSAQIIARALIEARQQKGELMAGGKFFALIDEMKASEDRLDKLAEPLLQKMADSEKLAERAVEAKHTRLDAAIDYIKRMDEVTGELEGDNGGPKLPAEEKSEGSTESQPSSDEQQ